MQIRRITSAHDNEKNQEETCCNNAVRLHPQDAGYRAMAESVDLNVLGVKQ